MKRLIVEWLQTNGEIYDKERNIVKWEVIILKLQAKVNYSIKICISLAYIQEFFN